MVRVSPRLVEERVARVPLLERAWRYLVEDEEIQELLRMSNVNAVDRLLYNDHGPVHAAIVAGSSLEIFELLMERGILPSSIAQKTVDDIDLSRLIVLLGAYLHDIGNSVHRTSHELIGSMIAYTLLDRILRDIIPGVDGRVLHRVKSEVLHVIYSTAMDVEALTIEASVVKVADATDIAEGRARFPYRRGKMDMHALSALSIRKVEVEPGSMRPLRIVVTMTSYAGFFQIERVLMPKIRTSTISDYVEVVPVMESGEGGGMRLNPIYP